MVTSKENTMSNDQHISQFKVFPSSNSNSSTSTSSTYYEASVTHRPSLPYLLFTVVVNLNALSLLPPKLDGQKRRHEIKSKPSGKPIKYHKNVLKKKLKRHNKNENGVIQLQRHCAFFFVMLLVVVMMSFGDAGGIIEESHYASSSNRNESLLSLRMNGETKSGRGGFYSHGYIMASKMKIGHNKIRHLRKEKKKVEARKNRGKYTMKEDVVKKKEHLYPCDLVQTAVKVTFPGMKKELLVSFMGYKEPDLMHVMRCKGICPNGAMSPVACVPTKRRLKKVAMHLKTQYIGHNIAEKFREVVLEEHEECGCQCLSVTSAHCMEPHLFNNDSCSCTCDSSPYKRDQVHCANQFERSWDPLTCSCRNKEETIIGNLRRHNAQNDRNSQKKANNVKKSGRPGHDVEDLIVFPGCLEGENCHEAKYGPAIDKTGTPVMNPNFIGTDYTVTDYIVDSSWLAITIFVLMAIVFASTTFYYWRKSRRMAKNLLQEQDDPGNEDALKDDEMATFISSCGNSQQMMLPLHHLQQLTQVQQNQSNSIKSPASSIGNHILNNHVNSGTLENDILSKTKDSNTILANVTNHTAKNVDTSAELEPLNPDRSPIIEKNSSDLHNMANGFCDNSENIYGNIVGSPSGKELKTGFETVENIDYTTGQEDENENNGDTDKIVPIVPQKGLNDISGTLQHTKTQLMMKPPRGFHEQEGNRGFAGDLAAQLGILVLRERQKQQQDSEHNEEVQQRMYELQHPNNFPPHVAGCSTNIISSSHTSPNKNIRHNHCGVHHEKPQRPRKKSNTIGNRNGSGGASVISNLSKAASMSELDGPPENENHVLLNDPITCSGTKGNSSGHIESINVPMDSMVCYRSSRRRRQKKNRNHYHEVVNATKTTIVQDDESNIATVITPFCGECAVSRVNPCSCEIDRMNHIAPSTSTFDRNAIQTKHQEEIHHLSSRSCGRIAETLSPPYDMTEPPSCRTTRKNKRPSTSMKSQAPLLDTTHEQQFHYLNSQHHRHHHANHTAIATQHAHNSYHHHDQHPLNHNHHRSQGQLLIDDAEILHQCLVSLAGERNVAMLLKRFQQRTQNNPLDDPDSPC